MKVSQNIKKEHPSNEIYMIDMINIHTANHVVLLFTHILNQARKKYLLDLDKNIATLLEQCTLIVSFYIQG